MVHSDENAKKIDYGDGVWPPDGYTGDWLVYWPNGAIKLRAKYVDGKETGQYVCYWDNGLLAQVGYLVDGVSHGVWLNFWESGDKYLEERHVSPGKFDQTWFDRDGKITEVVKFEDGIEVSRQTFSDDEPAQ